MPTYGGGEGCKRCGESVFHGEEKLYANFKYHPKCYACKVCGKKLDSVNIKGHEKEIYCGVCYGTEGFGVQGYGYGVGAGTLQSNVTK